MTTTIGQQLVIMTTSLRRTKVHGKICPGKLYGICGFGLLTLPERSSSISNSFARSGRAARGGIQTGRKPKVASCFLTQICAKGLSGRGWICPALWSIRCRHPLANDVGCTYCRPGSRDVTRQGFVDPTAITIPWHRYLIRVADAPG